MQDSVEIESGSIPRNTLLFLSKFVAVLKCGRVHVVDGSGH